MYLLNTAHRELPRSYQGQFASLRDGKLQMSHFTMAICLGRSRGVTSGA